MWLNRPEDETGLNEILSLSFPPFFCPQYIFIPVVYFQDRNMRDRLKWRGDFGITSKKGVVQTKKPFFFLSFLPYQS